MGAATHTVMSLSMTSWMEVMPSLLFCESNRIAAKFAVYVAMTIRMNHPNPAFVFHS